MFSLIIQSTLSINTWKVALSKGDKLTAHHNDSSVGYDGGPNVDYGLENDFEAAENIKLYIYRYIELTMAFQELCIEWLS